MMELSFHERKQKLGERPTELVIFLHGYGSNGADLLSLAPELSTALPRAHFISPDAPFAFEGGTPGAFQWYGLRDRSEVRILENARKVEVIMNEFIDTQLKRFNLMDNKLVVIGFSQGGMMAIHTMYRRPHAAKAVISLSGFLMGVCEMAAEIKSRPQALLTHGLVDTIVPSQALELTYLVLRGLGIQVTKHMSPKLGHGIDIACIRAVHSFLKELGSDITF